MAAATPERITDLSPSGAGSAGSGRSADDRSTADAVTNTVTDLASRSEWVGAAAPCRLAPGRVVPGTGYRITRWLGEGGMGVVYEAEHVDIERKVALKVLRDDRCALPQAAQAFRDEARTASQVGSEFIADIYDFGSLPDGRLLVTMELVDGRTLYDEVRRAPVAPQRLVAILRQVCKGLAAAHGAGIVHRDIKPENILLGTRDGRSDAVKIVDFGVARIHGAPANDARPVGTPLYMAPEVVSGLEYDGRVDIYSLGCTAYEMIVGHPPFDHDDPNAILLKHLSDTPLHPRQVIPDLDYPEPIVAVIMRCLAKSPQERFADFAELEAALCEAQISAGLETYWDDLPVPDVEPDRRARIIDAMPNPEIVHAKPRFRWTMLAASVVMSLIVGVLAYSMRPVAEQELDLVEGLTRDARAAAGRASWVYPAPDDAEGATAYRSVQDLEALPGRVADLGDTRATELREEFAEALIRLGDRYWEREEARVFAADYYAQALLFDPDNEHARSRVPLTTGELHLLRQKAADGGFSHVERMAARPLVILAGDDEQAAYAQLADYRRTRPSVSLAHATYVDALVEATVPEAAKDIVRSEDAAPAAPADPTAVASVPDVEGDAQVPAPLAIAKPDGVKANAARTVPQRGRAKSLAKEAAKAARKGNRTQAEHLYHQALAADQRYAPALSGLSNLLFERSQYARALRYAELAVSASPRNARYRIGLGDAYFKVMRYDDARTQYEKAVSLGERRGTGRIRKLDQKLGRR